MSPPGPVLTVLMIESCTHVCIHGLSHVQSCLCFFSAASDCQKPSLPKGPRTQLGSARDEIQKQGPSLLDSVQAYGGNLILESRAVEPVCGRELPEGAKVEKSLPEEQLWLIPGSGNDLDHVNFALYLSKLRVKPAKSGFWSALDTGH